MRSASRRRPGRALCALDEAVINQFNCACTGRLRVAGAAACMLGIDEGSSIQQRSDASAISHLSEVDGSRPRTPMKESKMRAQGHGGWRPGAAAAR
jgi:hypothetical protein